jgi:hypothetical protein
MAQYVLRQEFMSTTHLELNPPPPFSTRLEKVSLRTSLSSLLALHYFLGYRRPGAVERHPTKQESYLYSYLSLRIYDFDLLYSKLIGLLGSCREGEVSLHNIL